MIKLLILFLISSNALGATSPATCYVIAANGERFYKHNGKTKTLGTVAAIKPCAVNPLVIVYDDARGMKLYVNPMPDSSQPCLFLTVKERTLQSYLAGVVENGELVCK